MKILRFYLGTGGGIWQSLFELALRLILMHAKV